MGTKNLNENGLNPFFWGGTKNMVILMAKVYKEKPEHT